MNLTSYDLTVDMLDVHAVSRLISSDVDIDEGLECKYPTRAHARMLTHSHSHIWRKYALLLLHFQTYRVIKSDLRCS